MTRRRRAERLRALELQPDCCCGEPATDVVRAEERLVCFCRSCRLRHDAPTRCAKAARTRRLRRNRPGNTLPMPWA